METVGRMKVEINEINETKSCSKKKRKYLEV